MMLRNLFTSLILLIATSLCGQDNYIKVAEIDTLASRIDSNVSTEINIGHFIVAKYSDNDTTRLYNRYILDTISRGFYKCIYDCTFRGFEEVTFYFTDKELIKVLVKVKEYNEEPFNAAYYFEKGKSIYSHESKGLYVLWSIDRIKAQSKQYLNEMNGIIEYLDNRKSNTPTNSKN